jgi:hypothetical protein
MTEAKRIKNTEQKQEMEGVVSLLQHKIQKGIATEEEKALHRAATYELVIFDWQQSNENDIAEARAKAQERKRRSLIAPAPSKSLPDQGKKVAGLPPLTRKPGKFAV